MEEQGSRARVLIVDDDRTAHQVSQAFLAKDHYDFDHAYSGSEALERMKAQEPDVVLLDVMMPQMDGFETCRRIRSIRTSAYVPIMMVTALDDTDSLAKGLDAGADDFISKPVKSLELRARVRSLIRIRNQSVEMVRQAQELARLDQQREDLVRMVVHDLRSPLTAVQLAAATLLGSADNLTEEQRRDLQLIRAESIRVGNYLEEMLLLARQEAGKLRLAKKLVHIDEIIDEAVRSLGPVANAREITLVHDRSGRSPMPTVKGDRALLRRVIDNLLTNAIKFSPAHSTVRVKDRWTKSFVGFDVIDEGPGVPPDMRKKIFEKYEIVKLRSSGGPQTGLGLPLCRMVVEAHGGSIDCLEGPGGKGSLFRVELPRSKSSAEQDEATG